ncbi:MAG TPA: prealbumin-like fold domain-containing protein [Candidatus Limnocylindrales bacterium]|nr:prealbumin-like fold domain-containing protein [Candidatus Limnocylindrales bacterium]
MSTRELKRVIPRKYGVVAAFVIFMMAVGTAFAVHDDGIFQLDGNAFANDPGNPARTGDDWDEIDDGPTDPNNDDGATVSAFIVDPLDQVNDQIYTGGSTKDDLDTTGWRHTAGSVPDKDNIEHAFAAMYNNCDDGEDANSDPDQCLFFGLDRFARNGDAQVGFWFFKNDMTPNANGTFGSPHAVGDILVLSNFTNGGVVGTIKVYKWVGSGGDTNGTLQLLAAEGECATTVGNPLLHDSCGESNTTGKPSPWFYDAKSGPDNTFPQGSFYEGGINLSSLGLAGTCISSFIAETRSSQSVDAVLKDYAFGKFSVCDANIQIGSDGANRVGDTHTVTGHVNQVIGGVSQNAPAGTTITFSIVSGPGTLTPSSCTTIGTTGSCSVSLDSNDPGTTVVSASSTLSVAGTSFTVTTDGQGLNTGNLTKIWVNARISIDPDDVNRVGDFHTFQVTLEKNTGSGWVALDDEAVTVTLTGDADNVTDNCANGTGDAGDTPAEAAGICNVKFNSDTPGTVVGSASSAVTISTAEGNVSFTVSTGDANSPTGSATKRFVDARISIDPDAVNRVGDSHTFTVTVEANTGSGWAAVDVDAVTVNLAGDADNVVNTCTNGTGDVGDSEATGVCTVTFDSDTPGTVTGSASATVALTTDQGNINVAVSTTDANSPTGNAIKRFVDARISIDPDDTNSILEFHTFTVLVEVNTGSGWVAYDDDAVTVGLTGDADNVTDNCANGTGDAGDTPTETTGRCTVSFNSNTVGDVVGSASATVSITTTQGSINVPVSTGDANSPTGGATKSFVAGSVRWLKKDGDGNLLGGATFEVCRTHRLDSSNGTYTAEPVEPFCFTVLDNAAPDADNTAGELQVNNLILGKYTVKETIPPAGYHIGDNPGAGPFAFPDMTIANRDVTLATVFVNIKAFRIIVLTCDDITHELVVSSVDLNIGSDPAAVDSMNLLDLDAWNTAYNQDVTQAQLCGGNDQGTNPSLGGAASFGNLPDGTYDIRTVVPKAS